MIDEYDAIAAVLQVFIEGAATGNADKLTHAFHHHARLIGNGDKAYDMDREQFVTQYHKTPMDSDGRYRGRIVSVQMYGPDIATAVVAEDHCMGHDSFIDVLSLWKENGKPWKIVNKIFTQPHKKA